MQDYYLNMNKQPSGQYELHKDGCIFLKMTNETKYIGSFQNCYQAIISARQQYPDKAYAIDGCYYCCRECNNG